MGASSPFDTVAVERLLRRSFGADVTLGHVHQIRPWTVARCRVHGSESPPTVIVKWLRSNPEGFRVERRQIAVEAAALDLVGHLAPGVAPRLLASDLDRDLLITEDLAPRRTLHSVLSGGLSATGLAGLHTYAATMGRLHARTARATTAIPMDEQARLPISRAATTQLLDRLDGLAAVSRPVRDAASTAVETIEAPGPFAALSNGDSGANNVLVHPDGGDGRLIDFEHACRRHVLLDVAALHVPGSMWMTVADPVPLGLDDTYRRVVGEQIPAALQDDAYGSGLAAACALRALSKLQRIDKLDARPPGHHSRRQLVSTLERTVATLDHWAQLTELARWLADLNVALRGRWPDADVGVPDDYTLREPFDPDH